MKYILNILILATIMSSCIGQSENSSFETKEISTIQLGGGDLHGDLYRKKYPKPNDSDIRYNKWKGYQVSSNKEIEQILNNQPNCEAIKISYWNHDTLNNFELTSKIGEFKQLKFLEIHSNRITTYPKEIEKLIYLEEIVLQVRQKKEIEIDFSKFQNLKHLTIHFADDIQKFPLSIFRCKNLETLKLFRFFLNKDNVLNGVEKLSKLRELYIWDSNLTLPESADYNFEQLETLIIDRMRTPLPKYFYDSQSIKRLALSSMFDTLSLNQISKMKNLESISLSYQNNLTGDLKLPKLENLCISEYRGTELNLDFDNLPSLTSLTIRGCPKLTKTSEIFGNNLKSIVMVNNQKLRKLNYNPKSLVNLEEVVLWLNESLENRPSKINKTIVKKY